MLFDGGKQFAQVGSVSNHFNQTVELVAAFFTADAAVGVCVKNRVNEFLQVFVHNLTRCVTESLDEQILVDLTLHFTLCGSADLRRWGRSVVKLHDG